MQRNELEGLSRSQLIERAQSMGISRAEVLTRVELVDEIIRRTISDPRELSVARGLLGMARDLVASVVERGLHLPDAAARIRTRSNPPWQTGRRPIATVTLAEIYAAQGHRARALSVLDEVLEREPDHVAARELRDRIAVASRDAPVMADNADDRSTDVSGASSESRASNAGSGSGTCGDAPRNEDASDAVQSSLSEEKEPGPCERFAEVAPSRPLTSQEETGAGEHPESSLSVRRLDADSCTDAHMATPLEPQFEFEAVVPKEPGVTTPLEPQFDATGSVDGHEITDPSGLSSSSDELATNDGGVQPGPESWPAHATDAAPVSSTIQDVNHAIRAQTSGQAEEASWSPSSAGPVDSSRASPSAWPPEPPPSAWPPESASTTPQRLAESEPVSTSTPSPSRPPSSAASASDGSSFEAAPPAASLPLALGAEAKTDGQESVVASTRAVCGEAQKEMLIIIPLSPDAAYAYWELPSATVYAVRMIAGPGRLVLRLLAVVPTWAGPVAETRDGVVHQDTQEFWIYGLPHHAILRAALGWQCARGFEPLAIASDVTSANSEEVDGAKTGAEPRDPLAAAVQRARDRLASSGVGECASATVTLGAEAPLCSWDAMTSAPLPQMSHDEPASTILEHRPA